MGFRMGMNKLNFKNHIKKLRKDGIKISYKKGINRESLKSIGGLLSRYNGNGAYCIKTGVTRENSRDTEMGIYNTNEQRNGGINMKWDMVMERVIF